ncbi:MAG: hypothetical protein HYU99_06175 [Deltaproteobacteria bacterium]|nr:hypothetical protein [Deltaproteobacteria bacterium]
MELIKKTVRRLAGAIDSPSLQSDLDRFQSFWIKGFPSMSLEEMVEEVDIVRRLKEALPENSQWVRFLYATEVHLLLGLAAYRRMKDQEGGPRIEGWVSQEQVPEPGTQPTNHFAWEIAEKLGWKTDAYYATAHIGAVHTPRIGVSADERVTSVHFFFSDIGPSKFLKPDFVVSVLTPLLRAYPRVERVKVFLKDDKEGNATRVRYVWVRTKHGVFSEVLSKERVAQRLAQKEGDTASDRAEVSARKRVAVGVGGVGATPVERPGVVDSGPKQGKWPDAKSLLKGTSFELVREGDRYVIQISYREGIPDWLRVMPQPLIDLFIALYRASQKAEGVAVPAQFRGISQLVATPKGGGQAYFELQIDQKTGEMFVDPTSLPRGGGGVGDRGHRMLVPFFLAANLAGEADFPKNQQAFFAPQNEAVTSYESRVMSDESRIAATGWGLGAMSPVAGLGLGVTLPVPAFANSWSPVYLGAATFAGIATVTAITPVTVTVAVPFTVPSAPLALAW